MKAAHVGNIVMSADVFCAEPPRPLTRPLPPADPFPLDALGEVLQLAAGHYAIVAHHSLDADHFVKLQRRDRSLQVRFKAGRHIQHGRDEHIA